FKPYGLSFRGKSAVFPLTLGRAALCRRLRVSPFSKLKRSRVRTHYQELFSCGITYEKAKYHYML
ncbi:MAG TPA: hypothetical protein H9857_07975, partial [Candidatus Desulfovibrio intestinigallinarum]|nr:hypothetical protein [Candidatus Desulfovibrio intestinigallinarum]